MSFKGGPGGDIGDIEIKTTNTGSLAQLAIAETVSPPAPADGAGGILYTKADGKPYWISNEVSETDLSSGGGGGSDTITFIERGYSVMGFPHRKYLHYSPGFSTTYESSREWSHYDANYGHSQATSISVTPEQALAYWSSFIVPVACTINSAKIWYKSDQNQNTYFGIYSGDLSSADNSSNNITFTEMKRATSAGNTSGRMHAVSLTSLSNNSLAAGDMIAVALDGNQTTNGSWSAQNVHFQIVIQATPS